MNKITSPVGRGVGNTNRADVLTVQKLLNQHRRPPLSPIKEDGLAGPKTISAIEQFQREVVGMRMPDGRVDPGQKTIAALQARKTPSASADDSESKRPPRSALVVDHMYVIRRKLGKSENAIPTNLGILAHSALLLRTVSDRFYVLEYQQNSIAYLTETTVEIIKTFPEKQYAFISAKGHDGTAERKFYWTRQLNGTPLSTELSLTPYHLAAMMFQVMKGGYSVIKWEVCHTAQERLRTLIKTLTRPSGA